MKLNNASIFLLLVRPVYSWSPTSRTFSRSTRWLKTTTTNPQHTTFGVNSNVPFAFKSRQSQGQGLGFSCEIFNHQTSSFGNIRTISKMSVRDHENDVDTDSSTNARTSTMDEGDMFDSNEEELADSDDEIDTEDEDEVSSNDKSENDEVLKLYQRLRSSIEKALQAKKNKKSSLMKELEKAKSLEDVMKRANLIISNLYQLPSGTTKAIVQDWDNDGQDIELILNHEEYNTAQEEADALFASARKMKRGSSIIEPLLAETLDAQSILDDAILDLDDAYNNNDVDGAEIIQGKLVLLLDRLERTSSKTGFVMKEEKPNKSASKPSNYANRKSTRPQNTFRKFLSPGGCIVLVGRNRRDNESICFQVSRPTDIWMHSRGCPGAHVLVQDRRGSPKPTESCLQFAANLAAFYSDARTERRAPITTASPKHIQKPRGAPLGAVKLRQEGNTLIGYPEKVDDSLKIAREQSGVIWDESGSRSLGGKAKNRKRTMENSRKGSAKKREEKKAKRKRRQSTDDQSDFY